MLAAGAYRSLIAEPNLLAAALAVAGMEQSDATAALLRLAPGIDTPSAAAAAWTAGLPLAAQ